MFVPRFLKFDGYETVDYQTSVRDHTVVIRLQADDSKPLECHQCRTPLEGSRGRHRLSLKDLPLRGFKTTVKLWRRKGHCPRCMKARSEHISFLAEESPHTTQDYAWWLGQMCEFSPVSRVAEMNEVDNMSLRRIDLKRMQRMLRQYKIPEVTHIAVDEVYARRKKKHADEDRDQRFFTVITDLNTRRVIWVSYSRKKEALDEFFALIGKTQCQVVQVVAIDQHDGYAASVRQHCPNAMIVWDKFHIMNNFNEAVNEVRKNLYNWSPGDDPIVKLARGKYRYLFLKKDCRRTKEEKQHINEVVEANEDFAALEIIKERMLSFFDSATKTEAKDVLAEIGEWIRQKTLTTDQNKIPAAAAFEPLAKWWKKTVMSWSTLQNYFEFRVTSALAEGVNNVIKALKRRSFGFRNMDYFRLKIMQVCGYLNSRYIKFAEVLGT